MSMYIFINYFFFSFFFLAPINMKHRLSILGHSFVLGFSHHLRNKGALTPYQVAVALKLQLLLDAILGGGMEGGGGGLG